MRLLALLPPLFLAACGNPVDEAKDELRLVKEANRPKSDICAAQRKLQAAYLNAKDLENYKLQSLSADISCQLAEQSRER